MHYKGFRGFVKRSLFFCLFYEMQEEADRIEQEPDSGRRIDEAIRKIGERIPVPRSEEDKNNGGKRDTDRNHRSGGLLSDEDHDHRHRARHADQPPRGNVQQHIFAEFKNGKAELFIELKKEIVDKKGAVVKTKEALIHAEKDMADHGGSGCRFFYGITVIPDILHVYKILWNKVVHMAVKYKKAAAPQRHAAQKNRFRLRHRRFAKGQNRRALWFFYLTGNEQFPVK